VPTHNNEGYCLEVEGSWRRLHDEKFHNLHSSRSIRVSNRGGGGGGKIGGTDSTKFYSGNLKGRDHLGDAEEEGRIILKRILK